MNSPLTVLGLNCGASLNVAELPAWLEPGALSLINSAELICAAPAMLDGLGQLNGLKASLLPLAAPLEPLFAELAQRCHRGLRVLVLANGDPLFFGIGSSLARFFKAENLRIIPATSSLQAACARLALPWDAVKAVSLHGRKDYLALIQACSGQNPVCVLGDGETGPAKIAEFLLERGCDWFRAEVFERLGAKDESRQSLSLAQTAKASFRQPCLLMLIPSSRPRCAYLGIPNGELRADGCLGKNFNRAAALSMLRLGPDTLLWDIGAGSGAFALEASALAYKTQVFAIERSASRLAFLAENRRHFAALNLEIIAGEAPLALNGLPRPERIFIGGGLSTKYGPEILASACTSLLPAGRLVLNCVLLESLELGRNYLEKLGWRTELVQSQAMRSAPLGQGRHLIPENPAFILAADKPPCCTSATALEKADF